jgi:DNA-3-methyladenine glycosylase II
MIIKTEHLEILSNKDLILKKLIKNCPKPELEKSNDYLGDLIRHIIFQQISTKAGDTIHNRFLEFSSGKNLKESFHWIEKDWEKIGLSKQKKSYIENLFRQENLDMVNSLYSIEESSLIRSLLINLKGIGPWTIDMFLIFSKCDLNIFPRGDLAIIKVIKNLYNVDSMDKIELIAKRWAPYRSIATLYLWASLDGYTRKTYFKEND